MSKHTPGPWKADPTILEVKGGGYTQIARASFAHAEAKLEWPSDIDEARANACLISAAPELLEALKMALNQIRTLSDGASSLGLPRPEDTEAFKAMVKAMAKAEGQE